MQALADIILKFFTFLFPVFRTDSKNLKVSGLIIIIVNLLPLSGLLFFGWTLFQILLIYWVESLFIGFFNIFKMLISGFIGADGKISIFGSIMGVFLSCFFTVHYGGFMFGHLIFLVLIGTTFLNNPAGMTQSTEMADPFTSIPLIFLEKYHYSFSSVSHFFSSEIFALIIIFISHLYQFYSQFLKEKEYRQAEAEQYMMRPYRRIVIMHLTIIFGMMAVMFFQKNIAILIVWIVVKIIADIQGFYLDHKKKLPDRSGQRETLPENG